MRPPRSALLNSSVSVLEWRWTRIAATLDANAATSSKARSGSIGTTMWKPLEPDVLMPDGKRSICHGTLADVRQHDWGNRLVVRGEFSLGEPVLREQHLLGVADHLHPLGRSPARSRRRAVTRLPGAWALPT